MDKIKSLTFFNLASNGIRVFLAFLTSLFLARWLGSQGFGEINLILGYTAFLHYFLALGFDHSLAFYLPKFEAENKKVLAREILGVAIKGSILSTLILTLFGLLILPKILRNSGLEHFLLPSLILGLQMSLGSLGAILGGFLRGAKVFSALIFKDQILFPALHLLGVLVVLGCCGYRDGAGVVPYAWIYGSSTLISLFYAAVVVSKHIRTFYSGKELHGLIAPNDELLETAAKTGSFKKWKEWFYFSIPLGLMGALEPLLQWGTIVVLGFYLIPGEIGKYSVCMRVGMLIQFCLLAIGPVFSPFLAQLYREKKQKEFKQLYQSVNYFCTLWSLLLGLVLLLTGESVLSVFGKEFPAGYLCFSLLLAGNVIEGSFGTVKFSLIMSGKSHVNTINIGVGIVLNFLFCFLWVPGWGINGAALAGLVSYSAVNILRVSEFYLYFKILPYGKRESYILSTLLLLFGVVISAVYAIGLSPFSKVILCGISLGLLGVFGLTTVNWEDIRSKGRLAWGKIR